MSKTRKNGRDSKRATPERSEAAAAGFPDRASVARAVRDALREALIRHKRLGQWICVRDGERVVEIPPEKIRVDD
jgi:hypothetical protein